MGACASAPATDTQKSATYAIADGTSSGKFSASPAEAAARHGSIRGASKAQSLKGEDEKKSHLKSQGSAPTLLVHAPDSKFVEATSDATLASASSRSSFDRQDTATAQMMLLKVGCWRKLGLVTSAGFLTLSRSALGGGWVLYFGIPVSSFRYLCINHIMSQLCTQV